MLLPLPRPRPSQVGAAALLALVVLGAGCRNACQDLCVRLADYAEECGFTVPEAELDACIEEQAKPDDRDVCRDFGDAETIRSEWSCDELAVYWGAAPTE